MTDNFEELDLKDTAHIDRIHDRRGPPHNRELGLDIRSLGRGLLRRNRLVHLGKSQSRLAGHHGRRRRSHRHHRVAPVERGKPDTTAGPRIGSIWIAMGISMFSFSSP